MWRCLKNFIPCKGRLWEKGCNVDLCCLNCGVEETVDHVFLECSKAVEVWQTANISIQHNTTIEFILIYLVHSIDALMERALICSAKKTSSLLLHK